VAGIVRSGLEAAGWLALKCALAFDFLLFSVKVFVEMDFYLAVHNSKIQHFSSVSFH